MITPAVQKMELWAGFIEDDMTIQVGLLVFKSDKQRFWWLNDTGVAQIINVLLDADGDLFIALDSELTVPDGGDITIDLSMPSTLPFTARTFSGPFTWKPDDIPEPTFTDIMQKASKQLMDNLRIQEDARILWGGKPLPGVKDIQIDYITQQLPVSKEVLFDAPRIAELFGVPLNDLGFENVNNPPRIKDRDK